MPRLAGKVDSRALRALRHVRTALADSALVHAVHLRRTRGRYADERMGASPLLPLRLVGSLPLCGDLYLRLPRCIGG